jgi:VanZ family protein
MPTALQRPALTSARHWRRLLMVLLIGIAWLAFSPDPPPSAGTGWDKLNHVLAFAAVAACGWFAWGRTRHRTAGVVLGALVYGVLIELVQTQIPGRSGEWPDLLADAIGIGLGLALAATLSRRRLTP